MSYLITEWNDSITDATGYLVIDQMKNGFCAGGIRMRKDVTKEEVARLAEIMTIKMAGLGLEIGGAKGGIDFDSKDPRAKEVLERYLQAHLPFIEKQWLTSEDLGTREEDIIEILQRNGLHSSVDAFINRSDNPTEIFQSLDKALKATYEGQALTDLVTGYGVMVTTCQGLLQQGIAIENAKIAVQGFGSVGASAAKFLYEKGAKIIAVSDVLGTIYASNGLDVPLLLRKKDKQGIIDRSSLPEEYQLLSGDQWLQVGANVLIPATIADVIREDNVEVVEASLIVEGANIPITEGAEKLLLEKGIYIIPDFIANSGGASLFVSILTDGVKGDPTGVFRFLEDRLAATTQKMMDIANSKGISLRKAASYLIEGA